LELLATSRFVLFNPMVAKEMNLRHLVCECLPRVVLCSKWRTLCWRELNCTWDYGRKVRLFSTWSFCVAYEGIPSSSFL